jgi:hypothetical protein
VRRTAAALIALVLLGHTRIAGVRKRTVAKAAGWLEKRTEPEAQLALDVLARAERGERVSPDDAIRALADAGPEGAALGAVTRLWGRRGRVVQGGGASPPPLSERS